MCLRNLCLMVGVGLFDFCYAQDDKLDNTYYLTNVKPIVTDAKVSRFEVSPKLDKIAMMSEARSSYSILTVTEIIKSLNDNAKIGVANLKGGYVGNLSNYAVAWSLDNSTLNLLSTDQVAAHTFSSPTSSAIALSASPTLANTLFYRINTLGVPQQNHWISKPVRDPGKFMNELNLTNVNTTLVKFNEKNRKIEAFKTSDPGKVWSVSDAGSYYNIIVSPDGKNAICNLGSDMILFSLAEGVAKTSVNLGMGIPSCWDPTGKFILYYLDEGDGHEINQSNIYMVGIDGKNRSRLTPALSGKIYSDPAWLEGGKIFFQEEKSGDVIVGELKKRQ